MSEGEQPVNVVVTQNETRKLANPAPLGLAAFGITTFLYMCHIVGLVAEFDAMILGMALIFGGVAQMIVGVLQYFKNSTFGVAAFTSYGAFWISLALVRILPKGFGIDPPSPVSLAFFMFVWGVFTTFLFVGTLKVPKIAFIQIIFFLWMVVFYLLAVFHLFEAFSWWNVAAVLRVFIGVVGISCGLLAMYLSGAEAINDHYGKNMLPLIMEIGK